MKSSLETMMWWHVQTHLDLSISLILNQILAWYYFDQDIKQLKA